MTGFMPLLKKEIMEQIRTYRLLIVGGVFLFFSLLTPITLKFLPQIIKLVGEQIPVEIPPPTAIQSLVEYAGTIGQIGVLVVVLITMGSVANELRHGTALITLSKPVSRSAFITAKFTAVSITFFISLVVASLICYVYTILLIEEAEIVPYVGLNLLLMLFLMFCLAVTVLFSSLFKSSLAAGGISIAIIITQALFSGLPAIGDYLPGKLLSWGTNLLSGTGESYWWAFAVTLALIGLCLYLAQRILKTKEI